MTTVVDNQTDAIKILIKAAQIAQSKGVFSLEEACTIHHAISIFIKNDNENVSEIKNTYSNNSLNSNLNNE